jgi:recombination protein RecT
MAPQAEKKEKKNLPQVDQGTVSERFTSIIIREFSGAVGKLEMTPYQKRLAQHLFIKIDQSLKELEKKRAEKDKEGLPIVWASLNLEKLAIDAVHRIELGLDALIPNHISPIPYLNSRTKKYDLDLRIGYAGKDYYRRQMSTTPPKDIVYELVHKNDIFRPIKASMKNPVESYEFEIPSPFDRGEVVGGFAYIIYDEPKKNKLIIVTESDFMKSKNKAQSKTFWDDHPEQMRHKTIVNRATSKLPIDPEKVNASFNFVEEQEDATDAARVQSDIDKKANTGEVIDITTGEIKEEAPRETKADAPPPEPVNGNGEKAQGRRPEF